MNRFNPFKRFRGVVGNAMVWGVGWSLAGWTFLAGLHATGTLSLSLTRWWLTGIQFGIVGTVAGGAFSGAVRLLCQGRRLSEISRLRFGLGGGLLAGLSVPLFLQGMNLISGDGLVPMALVFDDAVLAALLGTLAAGGTLQLAQLGETPRLADADSESLPLLQEGGPQP